MFNTCKKDVYYFQICIMPVRSGRLYCLVYFCTNWHFICISLKFCRGYTRAVVQNHLYFTNVVLWNVQKILSSIFVWEIEKNPSFYLRCHVFMTVYMKWINSKDSIRISITDTTKYCCRRAPSSKNLISFNLYYINAIRRLKSLLSKMIPFLSY